MALDIIMEWLPHHHHILILLKHMIPWLLPPKMRLKLSKLRGLICQIIDEGLIRLNLHWQKEVRLKLEHHNIDMLICTLDTIIIGMLHNKMHINMLHKPIKIHIVIVNVCLTLWLKRVIEIIHNHNIKGMFDILGNHILLKETILQMLNVFIVWPKVTQVMCTFIEDYT